MRVLICAVLVLALGAGACGGDSDEPGSADAASTSDASPALSWTSFGDDFFTRYCHDCHGAGDTLRDYSQLSMVRAEMDKIRCGVSAVSLSGCSIPARQFPIGTGPMPTDAERGSLVQWIDEGAIE